MKKRIKLYTDEQMSRAVILGLRQRGIDLLSTPEAGMMGAADEAHLKLATSLGRVLLTQDADFLRLNARGAQHAGIIYAQQSMAIGDIIREVLRIHKDMDADAMKNNVKYL